MTRTTYLGAGWVGNVNHPQTTTALGGAGGSDGVDHLGVLVGNDVVGAAKAAEAGGEVAADAKDLGAGDGQELLEVEDLETVVRSLGANVDVVTDDLHVTPRRRNGLRVETAHVLEGAIGKNLDESGSVRLADDTELATGSRGPT